MPTEIVFLKGGPEGQAADAFVHQHEDAYTHATQTIARQAFLQGIRWERERGDLEALGALRALLQCCIDPTLSPAQRAHVDKARTLLASRLKA